MVPPCPGPASHAASSQDPGSSLRVLGYQPPLPSRFTLHPLGRRTCPHRELLAQVDRSPTSPVSASCALYNQPLNTVPLVEPRVQVMARPTPPATGSRFVYPTARPVPALSHVDHSCTPPLSTSWGFYSRDQSLSLPWESMERAKQSPTLPVPRCYAVYSMDRSSVPYRAPAGRSPTPPLPRTYAIYSLERTLFSHLDPSLQPGLGSSSVPVSCAVYSMDSSSPSPEPLAQPTPDSPLFPPLLLAVYSVGQRCCPPHLELLSQIDRSCTPPVSASCAVYSRDAPLNPSPGWLAPST
ncbi:vegetative cell wall protein gp1-like [Trachemys scripta elegans]|uniref:vegetative cell wall protein gp1-like n=1 Tax=Trachemys scripta elegans TaxID=31138 RepID=UPI0015572E8F|nr:vegetative cell wall protein gp1-like [Trachemys scripta elegans]